MMLSHFSRCFKIENSELVTSSEVLARLGEPADFFHSYCMYREELYSVNVQYSMQPYYRLRTPEFHTDKVFLNRYTRKGRCFEITERLLLGAGEDPRLVSNGTQAFAIIKGNFFSGCQAILFNLTSQTTIPIHVQAPNFEYGKNWQPVFINDDLYFVHELTPFRVIRIDTETGRGDIVRDVDLSFNLTCFHSTYPMFRGGGNAITIDRQLFGVGRATSQRYRHHPFFWSMDEHDHLEIIFTEYFYQFHRRGFNIIDPTSLFIDGEDIFLGLCCSERDWAHTQIVSNMLLRITQGAPAGDSGAVPLADYFARQPTVEDKGTPNLGRHIFFCLEMPSTVQSVQEYGGRASVGVPGHLVHGPYLRIQDEGTYRAALSYLTKVCPNARAGAFEVVVSHVDENDRQWGFETLNKASLKNTDGDMGECSIEFTTAGRVGMLLEFRVFVEDGVMMNAFHVRTQEWGGATSPHRSAKQKIGIDHEFSR